MHEIPGRGVELTRYPMPLDTLPRAHPIILWIYPIYGRADNYSYPILASPIDNGVLCFWILLQYFSKTWHTVAIVRRHHNPGNFDNMLCWLVTVWCNSVTCCHIVLDSMLCCFMVPSYCSNTWHYVGTVRHTDNSDSSHNMLCWIVTVFYNSASYCYIVYDSMFCFWIFPPYCQNTWHTVVIVRHSNNSGSFQNMICSIVTKFFLPLQHTLTLFVTACLAVGLSSHTVQTPDITISMAHSSNIMLGLCVILIVLATYTTCWVELWQCVTTVQHTITLFVTACSVVGVSRHHGP
jgi:hypothetical protein